VTSNKPGNCSNSSESGDRTLRRLLLVTGSFPPMQCGVGAYTAALAEGLAQIGRFEVGILTSEGAAISDPASGIEVLPLRCDWNWGDLLALTRAIRGWRPDLVHIQYPTQAYGDHLAPWILPAILRVLRIQTVETWHEFLPHSRLLRIIVALAAVRIVVVRPQYESSLPRWFLRLLGRARPQFIPNAPSIEPLHLSDTDRIQTKLHYARSGKNLVVCFGFIYPHKGVEQLFEIADPDRDQLLIAGHFDPSNPYHRTIASLADSGRWRGSATLTGFMKDADLARLLASADAIVFPFREGAGTWNTSVTGAQMLGTFVVVTSAERRGYDEKSNTYFCVQDDVGEMRSALRRYVGRRVAARHQEWLVSWKKIAEAHWALYERVLRGQE